MNARTYKTEKLWGLSDSFLNDTGFAPKNE